MTDQAQVPSQVPTPAAQETTPTETGTEGSLTPAAVSTLEPVQENSTTAEPTSFLDQLPEDFEGAQGLEKFRESGVSALAKSYLELEAKFKSGDKLPLPKGTPAEDPEGWKAIFDKMGRPEDASKYSISELNDSDPLMPGFMEKAHGLGFSDDQASGIYQWFRGETVRLSEEAARAGTDAMKVEWGGEFLPKLERADEFLNSQVSATTAEKLRATGIASDPDFIKFVYNAAVKASEDVAFQSGEGKAVPHLENNPYKADTFNLTRQSQLERGTPDEMELAQRYRQEAGYTGP